MRIFDRKNNRLIVTSNGSKIVLKQFDIANYYLDEIPIEIEYQGAPWVEETYKKYYTNMKEKMRRIIEDDNEN